MSSWLLALLSSSQVPYELLAIVLEQESMYTGTQKELVIIILGRFINDFVKQM